MNVSQLRDVIEDLPGDMRVVFRSSGNSAEPIAGIHVRPYSSRRRYIAEPGEDSFTECVLVLNPVLRP